MGNGTGRYLPARVELFSAILVVAALNAASHRILSSLEAGLGAAALDLFKISAIIWFALYAILRIGLENAERATPTRTDVMVLAGVILAAFLPTRAPALLAMLAGATYLLATSSKGSAGRRISGIVLTLAGPLLLGPLMLNLAGTELLPVDAWLAATLSGNTAVGNVVQTPLGVPDLLIMPGCSAFGNLTLVVVLAVTLANLMNVPFGPGLRIGVLAAGVAVIIVNTVRLASMAIWPENFEWLHVGGGATLFGYATLLVMAPIIGVAVMRSVPDAA